VIPLGEASSVPISPSRSVSRRSSTAQRISVTNRFIAVAMIRHGPTAGHDGHRGGASSWSSSRPLRPPSPSSPNLTLAMFITAGRDRRDAGPAVLQAGGHACDSVRELLPSPVLGRPLEQDLVDQSLEWLNKESGPSWSKPRNGRSAAAANCCCRRLTASLTRPSKEWRPASLCPYRLPTLTPHGGFDLHCAMGRYSRRRPLRLHLTEPR
jgi:hypothetical protein